MNGTELRGYFEDAQKIPADFAYLSMLFFVSNIGCGLHISSLQPAALNIISDVAGRSFHDPLAIIGVPRDGFEPVILKLFTQPDDCFKGYILGAIEGARQLLLGYDPRLAGA